MSNVVRRVVAKEVREGKCNMFTTMGSIDEVIDTYGLKGEQVVALMIACNTLLEQVAKSIEEKGL